MVWLVALVRGRTNRDSQGDAKAQVPARATASSQRNAGISPEFLVVRKAQIAIRASFGTLLEKNQNPRTRPRPGNGSVVLRPRAAGAQTLAGGPEVKDSLAAATARTQCPPRKVARVSVFVRCKRAASSTVRPAAIHPAPGFHGRVRRGATYACATRPPCALDAQDASCPRFLGSQPSARDSHSEH